VEVTGYAIPGGTADVHLDITEVSGEGGMIVSGLPISIELGVEYALDLQFETTPDPGVWNGAVFLGPTGSPTAIEIPVTLYQGGAEKTAMPDMIYPGDLVTFTIELEENPGDLVGWTLEDAIPDGLEFVSVEGAAYDGDADAITWDNAIQPWLDATTALAIASGTTDDGYGALSMPFDFTFFGDTIAATSEMKVSTNGYATFGPDGIDYGNDAIPNTIDPNDYVAPFWDDQKMDNDDPSQGMWYGVHSSPGDQVLALAWRIQDLGTRTQPNEFQAQIHENGDIWFLYRDMNEERDGWGNSATIGLENSDGLIGTQYSVNSMSITDDWAIHFTPNVTGTYDIVYAGPLYETFGNHALTLTLRAVTPGVWTNTAFVTTGAGSCPISDTVRVAEAFSIWEKEIRINDTGPWLPSDGPFAVIPGDVITITDHVTVSANGPVSYTLLETWTPSLDLLSYEELTGTVQSAQESLEWTVQNGTSGAQYVLTKTFEVNGEGRFYDALTETLTVEGSLQPEIVPVEFTIPALLSKDGPTTAVRGDVISYTLVVEQAEAIQLDGSLMLTDVLPSGIKFAGNLTATLGSGWYLPDDGAVYWNNALGRASAGQTALQAAPGVTITFDVTVTALPGAVITNVAWLAADGTLQPASHTLTVLSTGAYGVALAPEAATQGGMPGSTVTYTLALTNTGLLTDTFTLSHVSNAWPVSYPSIIDPLAPGAVTTLTVTVDIPASAAHGDSDAVAIIARSESDPLIEDSSTLTTTATFYALYLPTIWKE
jgi:hypothetical protein